MTRRRNEILGRARVRTLKIRGANATQGNATIGGMLVGSAAWDPGSLVDAAGESKDVSVPGAGLGDFAIATFNKDLVGATISCGVKSSGVVTVRIQNESGDTLDLAAGTVSVLVLKATSAL